MADRTEMKMNENKFIDINDNLRVVRYQK